MGTIVAQTIVNKAKTILQDTTSVRWPESELLDWLNEGQRQIALVRPDASVVIGNITMVQGTKQSLPAAGLRLLDVTRNMGASGTAPGDAIRLVDREILDAQRPGWHYETAVAIFKHFIFDQRNPRTFFVWPPADGTSAKVEAIYSVAPAEVLIGAVIGLDDIYEAALLDWVLYRAYCKDAEYAGNNDMSAKHMSAFMSALQVKTMVDVGTSPSKNAPPFNPNSGGGMK